MEKGSVKDLNLGPEVSKNQSPAQCQLVTGKSGSTWSEVDSQEEMSIFSSRGKGRYLKTLAERIIPLFTYVGPR